MLNGRESLGNLALGVADEPAYSPPRVTDRSDQNRRRRTIRRIGTRRSDRRALRSVPPDLDARARLGELLILAAWMAAQARKAKIPLSTVIREDFGEDLEAADLREICALIDDARRRSARPAPQGGCDAETTLAFRREGHFWTVGRENGSVIRLKDMKGLHLIARLLRAPGKEIGALQLVAMAGADFHLGGSQRPGRRERAGSGLAIRDLGDAGEVLDSRAKAEYRERLSSLRAELDEARMNNDPGHVERLSAEVEMLTRELVAAVGLRGRDRRVASSAERARVALTKAIRAAIATIAKEDAELGRHLQRAVRSGRMFCYLPGEPAAVRWSLD